MSNRTIIIIVALLAAVVALALAIDLFAPGLKLGLGGLIDPFFSRRPDESGPRDQLGPFLTQVPLPRAVRTLASIAALAGYGLLLRYLVPARLATLVRALSVTPAGLARHGLNGLALLILLAALILLAVITMVASLLAPLLGISSGATILTGLVALAMSIGQRVRARAGALEHNPSADLLTGLPLFFLISLIPYLGVLVLIAAGLIGLGAVAATRFGTTEQFTIEPLEY